LNKDWSVDLEHGEYETNIELVIEDGIQAVKDTEPGYYVNLVTPNGFDNPNNYLKPLLLQLFNDTIKVRYIDQCGCGGYVLRVWKVIDE
jgi:putative CGCGG family rSAM target protein